MISNGIVKYRKSILLTIGTLLIVGAICLILYDRVELLKKSVFDEIELEKYRETNANTTEIETEKSDDVAVNNLDTQEVEEEAEVVKEAPKKDNSKFLKDVIGYLEIKKINLKQALVGKNSYYNNVNRNIQILAVSDYPDKEKGNTILAAHSGPSSISYFKNLYKLVKGDEAKIYYKGNVYTYKIVDIYNVPKTGSLTVKREFDQTTLTLITCTHNSKTEQTVYILNLVSKEKEG